MMKRGFVNSHQLYGFSMDDSKVNRKYQNLLEDFLELQKEYVAKKKKLQITKDKREILLDEVRFLRQRHKYLTRLQFAKVESEVGLHQNAEFNILPTRKERNYIVNESDNIEPEGRGREELGRKAPSMEKKKKHKNSLISDKKNGKRKISWQDEVSLKV